MKNIVYAFYLYIILSTPHFCYCQTRQIDSLIILQNNDTLKHKYHFINRIPKQFETTIFGALQYFPELENTKIIFKNSHIKTTLNVRPTLGSLFLKQRNRRIYIIRINNRIGDSIVTLRDIPFNAQLGLLGHEFCHIVDYSNKRFLGIAKIFLSYTKNKNKEIYEKRIDLETIKRGLGWQLYDWAYFIMYQSKAKKKYKIFKMKFYLEPEEIATELKKR